MLYQTTSEGYQATAGVPGPAPTCVVYCRVSDPKQKTEGDGLNSQEQRCRDYAAVKGYEVLKVFTDDVTGGTAARAGIVELLAFLEERQQQSAQDVVVIVDDLKRFARDVQTHFDLKLEIFKRGGRLESPLFRFEDTPEGKFMETIVAAQAELERNQNRRQVRNRMQSRLERGYWTFQPPPGYTYQQHRVHKKVLVLDTARADIIKQALEGFAVGDFVGQMDVWRFLAPQGFFGAAPRKDHLARHLRTISRILRQVLYTGHLEYPAWGISLRPAHHPAIISLETYYQIRDRLAGKPRTDFPTGASYDFPLRGVVNCAVCDRPLTGSTSRGRHGGRFPYYHCGNRACERYGNTIRPDHIEADFLELLTGLRVPREALTIMEMRVNEWATGQAERWHAERVEIDQELGEITSNLKQLAVRLSHTSSEIVGQTLEAQIEDLVARQNVLHERLQSGPKVLTAADAGTTIERVRDMLETPDQTWKQGTPEMQKQVVRRVFSSPLRYSKEDGFGTPEIALPYQISSDLTRSNYHLVDPACRAWEHLVNTLLSWARVN